MNLVSCDNCGVVLDKDKLVFPDIYEEDDSVIGCNSAWDGDTYVAVLPCPVCKEEVWDEQI